MIDGQFLEEVPHYKEAKITDTARSANPSISDFFNIYIPYNLEDEISAKIRAPWHSVDYSIYSDTSDLTEDSAAAIVKDIANTILGANPSIPSSYKNVIYAGMYFEDMGYIPPAGLDYLYGEASAQDQRYEWESSNIDFDAAKISKNTSPSTRTEMDEYTKSVRKNITYKYSHFTRTLLNKLDTKKWRELYGQDYDNQANVKRKVNIPILFLRKPATNPVAKEVNGQTRLTYPDIEKMAMVVTAYNALELDHTYDQALSETKQLMGKTFRLRKGKVAGFTGAAYYAFTQMGMSITESLRYAFPPGTYIGGHVGIDSSFTDLTVPDTNVSEFNIEIKQFYRDNEDVYVEYYIQDDYSFIPSAQTIFGNTSKAIDDTHFKADTYNSGSTFSKSLKTSGAEKTYTKTSYPINFITHGTTSFRINLIGFMSFLGKDVRAVAPTTEQLAANKTLTEHSVLLKGVSKINNYDAVDWQNNSVYQIGSRNYTESEPEYLADPARNTTGSQPIDPLFNPSKENTISTSNHIVDKAIIGVRPDGSQFVEIGSAFVAVISVEWTPFSFSRLSESGQMFSPYQQRIYPRGNKSFLDCLGVSIEFQLKVKSGPES